MRQKRYKPKPVNPLAAFDAIHMVKPVTDNAKAELELSARSAITAFTNGVALKLHFYTLASLTDLCTIASKSLFNDAYPDEIANARNALMTGAEVLKILKA